MSEAERLHRHLIGQQGSRRSLNTPALVLDLERLQSVPAERAGPLARYAATIQGQRGDYNGKVLSIRTDDLRTLAVIYDAPAVVLAEQLIAWGVLNADARRAVAADE